MDTNTWVVVANVGESVQAARSDSSGDMEQLELLELVLMSEHESKEAAEAQAAARRAQMDGWAYSVMPRRYYDARTQSTEGAA